MLLEYLKYSEWEGHPQEWVLEDFTFCKKNLIVGKNASGKSRILAVINSLARHLAGLQRPSLSSNYDCKFQHDKGIYRYQLHVENEQVVTEKLWVNDELLLDRGTGGEGSIFAQSIDGGIHVRFQAPTRDLAAVVRRDTIQHPFLEPLYTWASSVRFYPFGTPLGKDQLAIFLPQGGAAIDERDANVVVALFRKAEKEYPETFASAVKSDLECLDYHVAELGIAVPISVRISGPPGEVVGLFVKEKDLSDITDQFSMSQGMFRVLSLLIHLNYSQLKKSASCVLIDDIGEGLDFDRSCRLIELLRSKADQSDIQIILSTNDRFVMNHIPLEEWSVLKRKGNHVQVINCLNSPAVFEEFKFTGLSNFSFLEMDVIGQLADEESAQ